MADRIRFSSEAYDALTVKLKRLSRELGDCSSAIAAIHLSQYESIGVSLASVSLQQVAVSIGADTAGNGLSYLRRALNELSRRAEDLSETVSVIKQQFEENETQIRQTISGENAASASVKTQRSGWTGRPDGVVVSDGPVTLLKESGKLVLTMGGIAIASMPDPQGTVEYTSGAIAAQEAWAFYSDEGLFEQADTAGEGLGDRWALPDAQYSVAESESVLAITQTGSGDYEIGVQADSRSVHELTADIGAVAGISAAELPVSRMGGADLIDSMLPDEIDGSFVDSLIRSIEG